MMARLLLIERTRCIACGAPRPRSQRWKHLCRPCWHWHRILTGLSLAGPPLRMTDSRYLVTATFVEDQPPTEILT